MPDENGLTLAEQSRALLIGIESRLITRGRQFTVATLRIIADHFESLLLNEPVIANDWFSQRLIDITATSNRQIVLAGALADLVAGDLVIGYMSGYVSTARDGAANQGRAHIAVIESHLMQVTHRTVQPLADIVDRYAASDNRRLRTIAAIARRRLAGQSLDSILSPLELQHAAS